MCLWYNGGMKRVRRGFTLVEVSLFLAITAAIFVSIAVGTQNSIFQQRYNDAVQNFAEFLRSTYSQVSNVQSEGTGRTGLAIYGKLIVFGVNEEENKNEITSYNVIGKIGDESSGGDVLTRLAGLNANVIIQDGSDFKPVGWVENYTPRWASQIQTGATWEDDGYEIFQGMLLIVRHPSSGTIYTFVDKSGTIDVDEMIEQSEALGAEKNYLKPLLEPATRGFEKDDVVFCVNPNGAERSSLRRGIRITAGARNASGVEILSDGEGCL